MLFRLLGPLEVTDGDSPVRVGEGRQRSVLVLLLLHRNEPIATDRLIDALWGEAPPATAAKVLQNQIGRLRRALGDREGRRLRTHGHAYALRVEAGELDVDHFERLVRAGGKALGDDRPAEAAARLGEALTWWRGPPLADVAYETFAQPEIARLEERRLVAVEWRIDAQLALGHSADLVAELDTLVAQHPLREHLRGQRMLALYRCGRQAEALEAFRDARRLLIEEVGVEPGAELRGMHEAILRHDPALELEPQEPLPRELHAALQRPIVGRDRELAWLRLHWERARGGAGACIALTGERGIGKTRLVAGIADDAHRDGFTVLYMTGAAPADALAATVRRARNARRPTLLVADVAGDRALDALRELAGEIATRPVLALATAESPEQLGVLGTPASEGSLELAPLDGDAVRRIALLYAAGGADDRVPVDALLARSGGVPVRVHVAASAWARGEARERVAASVPRAAAGRSEWRTAEAALVGSVVDLQAARDRGERLAAHASPVVCPFKGLASFDVADAAYFFGRERVLAELVAAAVGAPLLAVVGPSGSGKSSVVRAGLLSALADGVLPGSEAWPQTVLRPGEHPLSTFAAAGAGDPARGRTVLVVDQFEEVFTACRDEHERADFIDAVTPPGHSGGADRLVVLAIRADFYGRCVAYPRLAALLGANHVLVGPMHRDELRRAIELPAERAGLEVEPELVDALLADIEAEPGALPLLSTTLLELWRHRDGHRMRRAAYELTGGVRGAVARLAEDAFGRLDPSQQSTARRVLLHLADEGPDGSVVRRRVALSELEAGRTADVAPVLEILTERRLLTTSTSGVEVAHEALLREWPRLRGWLEEDAQGRRTHRRLTDAAREWEERGRRPGDLYSGARLAVALEWRGAHEHELTATERRFLDASRTAAGRAHRRLRLALTGIAALLVVAVVGAAVALHQRAAARTTARIADAQRLGATAVDERALDRSMLLARQGFALADTPITRGGLLSALTRSPAAIAVVQGAGRPLSDIDIAPDGRTLAVGRAHDGVDFVDAVTGREIGPPARAGPSIESLRYSPDGTRVAVDGINSFGDPEVQLLDARSHRRVADLNLSFVSAFIAGLGGLAFSRDSRVLAADYDVFQLTSPERDFVGLWDARTGRPIGAPHVVTAGVEPRRTLGGFIAGGTRIVTSSVADARTVIRDAGTLRPLRRFPGGGSPADVSADGREAALVARDGTARLVDLRTGVARRLGGGRGAAMLAMRFTPDSRRLVTAGRDEYLKVWDARNATPLATVDAHAGAVRQLAIAPDGRTAYAASEDGSVTAWDLSGGRRLGRPFPAARGTRTDVAPLTPDGATFAVAAGPAAVDLLDSRTLARRGRIVVGGSASSGRPGLVLATSRDGRTMAVGTAEGAVQFADVASERPRGPPTFAHVRALTALAFTPDGRWLATSGRDSAIYLWNVARQRPARLYGGSTGPATSLSVSPDGTTLAATILRSDGTGEIVVFRIPRLTVIARVPRAGTQIQFSRTGRWLLFDDDTGVVRTLDARTLVPRGAPLGVPSGLGRFALSPDEDTVAVTAGDGSTQLWDLSSRSRVGGALPGVAGTDVRTAFVDGGNRLVTLGGNGPGHVWDVRPQSWARRACSIAGRPLTRAEWHEALPQRAYDPACRPH